MPLFHIIGTGEKWSDRFNAFTERSGRKMERGLKSQSAHGDGRGTKQRKCCPETYTANDTHRNVCNAFKTLPVPRKPTSSFLPTYAEQLWNLRLFILADWATAFKWFLQALITASLFCLWSLVSVWSSAEHHCGLRTACTAAPVTPGPRDGLSQKERFQARKMKHFRKKRQKDNSEAAISLKDHRWWGQGMNTRFDQRWNSIENKLKLAPGFVSSVLLRRSHRLK